MNPWKTVPMARYRRKAETSVQSFRRRVSSLSAPGSAILIVTEGINTEPAYLSWIKERFAAPTVELVPHGAGRGDPRALADEALRLRNERKRAMRNRTAGIHRLGDFDEIWIVFDTDVITSQKLNDGIAYAHSKGIRIASSEPCFEFWLLLHERYTTAVMPKCADVIPYLEKFLGWKNYSRDGKKEADARALMEPLVGKERLNVAVSNALSVRKYHECGGTKFPANPSTDVDLLIKAINAAVSPANKFLEDPK
jgi:hypothetical protein